jgi:nitrate/nitrite-specific signal transduction histidine kinase
MAEGETAKTIAARVKVQLIATKWETIKAAVNNGVGIPTEASMMGYHYDLHRQGKHLLQERSEIQKKARISKCSKQNTMGGA